MAIPSTVSETMAGEKTWKRANICLGHAKEKCRCEELTGIFLDQVAVARAPMTSLDDVAIAIVMMAIPCSGTW